MIGVGSLVTPSSPIQVGQHNRVARGSPTLIGCERTQLLEEELDRLYIDRVAGLDTGLRNAIVRCVPDAASPFAHSLDPLDLDDSEVAQSHEGGGQLAPVINCLGENRL